MELMALGLPADRIAATGIPINKQLSPAPVRDANKPPMLLISAGATGGDYAVAVVRQTMHMRSAFTATVVCGHNVALRQRIEALVRRLATATAFLASRPKCRSYCSAPTCSWASPAGSRRPSAWLRGGSPWFL